MKSARMLAFVLVPFLFIASGCQVSGDPKAEHPAYSADVASGSNAGPIIYLVPTHPGGRPQAISTAGVPVCERCRDEAAHYFRTGNLATNCPICNASLTTVKGS